jgi:uncharacterized protein YbaR (Trm112 family)/SAM-dependent methyltransferase
MFFATRRYVVLRRKADLMTSEIVMRLDLLEILQCPFCGGSFDLERGGNVWMIGNEVARGLLCCLCATYPVIDGIPVLLAGYGGDGGFQEMLANEPEQALCAMLGLDEERQATFKRLLARGKAPTFCEWVDFFSPGDEGTYFVHRFANPTYLVGAAILRAIGGCVVSRRVIDLCGGAGHMARLLGQISAGAEVVLTERNFWKLWLAQRIVAPQCAPVCCDAEAPLPFKRGSFSLAVCSDAFHYIWSKRMLACEIMRLVGADGVIVLNHLHNALRENFSAGLPLAPQWWRNLFTGINTRLFKESEMLDRVLERRKIDLSGEYADRELGDEQALLLIATQFATGPEGLFEAHVIGTQPSPRAIRLNPLYQLQQDGENDLLRLKFPSEQYETEFAACKRYLPERLELPAGTLRRVEAGQLDDSWRGLAERHVLLDLPEGY